MNMLADRRVKQLFCMILLLTVIFSLIAALCIGLGLGVWSVPVACMGMGLCTLAVLYRYFQGQHRILQTAIRQIGAYLAGDRTARIESNEEGELYRLFHEVNTLAAVLNAHAENESQAKRFMKDTISDISHQLKTPLAALNVYNGIVQSGADDLPTVREFAARSEQELDRVQTLVQNLLKITKLDAGTMLLEKNEENLSELMGQIERQFQYRAEQEGKQLTFTGSDAVILVCDRSWMLEAVGNLIKNALDHTKQGDHIGVTWRAFARIVQVVVKDTGSGIDPQDLPHIFKRFYRSRFSKDTQGIGLGLPLAKAIIEAHSGAIEVDSTPGIGTTFTINFCIPTKL